MSSALPVPGIPCDAEGPVFGAPWQAQAFAMAVALNAKGVFSWPEWAQVFGEHIRSAPAQPGEGAGDAYYRQWLTALEDIVARKGAASAPELHRWQHAWEHAADRTPHGQPIEVRDTDLH
jgi:nitrile hydratase accessory protein